MLNDIKQFVDWAITSFKSLYSAIGTWGIIGAFIITRSLVFKVSQVLKTLWKGGI